MNGASDLPEAVQKWMKKHLTCNMLTLRTIRMYFFQRNFSVSGIILRYIFSATVCDSMGGIYLKNLQKFRLHDIRSKTLITVNLLDSKIAKIKAASFPTRLRWFFRNYSLHTATWCWYLTSSFFSSNLFFPNL